VWRQTQERVTNLEKRSDVLVSTLREYIEALGGELEILATFPSRKAVTIKTVSDVVSDQEAHEATAAALQAVLPPPWKEASVEVVNAVAYVTRYHPEWYWHGLAKLGR